jgi:hypothetical protein
LPPEALDYFEEIVSELVSLVAKEPVILVSGKRVVPRNMLSNAVGEELITKHTLPHFSKSDHKKEKKKKKFQLPTGEPAYKIKKPPQHLADGPASIDLSDDATSVNDEVPPVATTASTTPPPDSDILDTTKTTPPLKSTVPDATTTTTTPPPDSDIPDTTTTMPLLKSTVPDDNTATTTPPHELTIPEDITTATTDPPNSTIPDDTTSRTTTLPPNATIPDKIISKPTINLLSTPQLNSDQATATATSTTTATTTTLPTTLQGSLSPARTVCKSPVAHKTCGKISYRLTFKFFNTSR